MERWGQWWAFNRVMWQTVEPRRRREAVRMTSALILTFGLLLFALLAPWPQWMLAWMVR